MENTTWDLTKKGTAVTLSNNNLTATVPTAKSSVLGTNGKSAGKLYFEIHVDGGSALFIGIANTSISLNSVNWASSYSRTYYEYSGNKFPNDVAYGSRFAINDIIGVAVDLDAGALTFYKNNISQEVAFTDVSTLGTVFPFITCGSYGASVTATLRTTLAQFSYSPPKGYSAWDADHTIVVPINLTAIAGDTKVTLLWDAVTGAIGYNVKCSTTAGGPYDKIVPVAGINYVDTTVTNGTTYYYVVTVVTADGESDNSNEASAMPKTGSITPPMPVGNALLRVTMIDSSEREYRLSSVEIDGFVNWYNSHKSTEAMSYALNDAVDNSREYLCFEKIISFKVISLAK